jgi:phage tail sheath gpL-like
MASFQRIVIECPESADQFKSICPLAVGGRDAASNLAKYIDAVPAGVYGANIKAKVGAVKAAATLTVSGAGSSNGETMVLCNVTLTAVTSGATGPQFNISATPATQAANMVTCINAQASLAGMVSASSALGVVTITAEVPGLIGNALQLSEGLTNVALSAFAGGTDGTAYEMDLD